MKRLKSREEIATAINFKKYPVVTIDVSKRDEYGIVGCPVCISAGFFRTGEPHYVKATCRVYSDEQVLTFTRGGAMIAADFGYRDIEEMLEYANVPIINPDSEVLLVIIDSKKRVAYEPVVIRTSVRADPYCSTPLTFAEPLSFAWAFKEGDMR